VVDAARQNTAPRHDAVIHPRHENCPGLETFDPMYFDRDTVTLLRTALDRAWASLPPGQQAATSRSILAERILKAAAQGERDPERLRAFALFECTDLEIAS
jgi:hypothetical protein